MVVVMSPSFRAGEEAANVVRIGIKISGRRLEDQQDRLC